MNHLIGKKSIFSEKKVIKGYRTDDCNGCGKSCSGCSGTCSGRCSYVCASTCSRGPGMM